MTRAKLIKIAKIALNNHAGEAYDQQAIAVADAIEMALQIEADDDDPAPMPDPAFDPSVGKFADEDKQKPARLLPSSPAIRPVPASAPPESSRLVIMPDSLEARETMARGLRQDRPVDPIAISRVSDSQQVIQPRETVPAPKEGSGPPGEKVYWRVQDISQVLHAKTPPKISITVEHPEKGPVPIRLERNVLIGAGFDVVKLIYKAPWAPDGMEVSETFSCAQAELPIGEAMERIEQNAVTVYAPRERNITSRTPLRKGELSFDYDPKSRTSRVAAAGDES